MAEALKEIFNRAFYRELAGLLHEAYSSFDEGAFVRAATAGLAKLELNERMRRTAQLMHEHLTPDFRKNVAILKQIAPELRPSGGGYAGIFVPEYVACFGADEPRLFDFCMQALRDVTEYSSSELAVREFLKRDFDRAYAYMLRWSADENYHVRRLSSEGLRPRLPWSFRLANLVEDPSPARPILDNLRADPELYVRKSVANHLNDISKDHPGLHAGLDFRAVLENKRRTHGLDSEARVLYADQAGPSEGAGVVFVRRKAAVKVGRNKVLAQEN